MVKIEKFDKNSRVIGKLGYMYIITNHDTATLHDSFELAAIVDENGRYYTESVPINYLLRDEEAKWEEIDGKYEEYIKLQSPNLTKDTLIGFATGDALGVPVEFLSREDVRKIKPKEMLGCDIKPILPSRWGVMIPSGSWSDDTSMLIAAMDSIRANKGIINYESIMNNFLKWWEEGEYCSLDMSFGLGRTVGDAFERYKNGVAPLECGGKDEHDNGNGSLMRILPFSLYCIETEMNEKDTAALISEASSITHGHDISKMSCFIYTEFLRIITITKNPLIAYNYILNINYEEYFSKEAIAAHKKILDKTILYGTEEDISEKNGYVVATLESVLFSILESENYEEALLNALSFGYDTDTIGGITGSIAGALYGYEDIPKRWLNKLKKREQLEKLALDYEDTLSKVEKRSETFTLN